MTDLQMPLQSNTAVFCQQKLTVNLQCAIPLMAQNLTSVRAS